jgi:DNA mismatch repair protein MutS2
MNERTLRVLEYYKVLDRVAHHTSFEPGRELVMELRPSLDQAEAQKRLDITGEARDLLELRPETTIGGAKEVRGSVKAAALGRSLDATSFLDIAATLLSSRNLRRTVVKAGGSGSFFYLAEIAQRLVDLPLLESEIEQTISPDGMVLDSASPALRRIRNEIKTAHNRLLERVNQMLSSSQYQSMIQDAIVTMRDGRYVIPVKAAFKGQMRGIIHDSSASGQTVFMEPLAIVDLNNRWRELQMDEREEIERVLLELAGKVGRHGDEIVAAVDALAELDLAFAKARYANAIRATKPRLVEPDSGEGLNFIQARHPLLTSKVVPIDLYMGEKFRILVITGPNTGGKTVSIKTAGLLTLMAQAGLHLPVEDGSQALVFQKVLADIGDEQSIEQSLSTFSSHLTNIISMLDKIDDQTLVILDELGAGTDPQEGSALARSIIQFLLRRNACAVITTHYSELKSFAYVTSGVQNASVEFNVETLSPTYRLVIGLPGRSNALAIASRLGLPAEIIDEAQEMVAPEEIQVDAMLAQIQREREETIDARLAAMKIRAEAERERDELNRRLRHIDEERKKAAAEARTQARSEMEDELEMVRQQSRNLRERILEVEGAVQAAGQNAELTAQLEKQRRELVEAENRAVALQKEARRRAQARAAAAIQAQLKPEEISDTALKVGDRVQIQTLGQEGQILGGPDAEGRYDVTSGAFKLKVAGSDLTKLKGKPRSNNERGYTARSRADLADADEKERAIRVNARARSESLAATTPFEYDIRGWRAEEVNQELDRYLNDAYLSNLPHVRIVHGKGTGVLRQVVRDILRSHPLISSFRLGEAGEGGDGVTVATIKH